MQEYELSDLGKDINNALDNNDAKELESIKIQAEKFVEKSTHSKTKAILHSYIANIYSGIRQNLSTNSVESNNLHFLNEIYNLRKSRSILKSISPQSDDLKYRVNTNLANILNSIGRYAEALQIFNETLYENPNFSMAIANRGRSLRCYADALYDVGHQVIFYHGAYKAIKTALKQGVEKHAEPIFKHELKLIPPLEDWDKYNFNPQIESRGCSKLEKQYRKWSIDNCLFLNPLNDLKKWNIAANDCLTFPSVTTSINECRINKCRPPEVYGIYNQLKQEYISARYIIFEAIQASEANIHFSDERVILYNMLDYRHYGLWIEKIKMAFLATYAIFDKIAYLINEYWGLNLKIDSVSFKNIWFNGLDKKEGLLELFANSENLSLRGLYWISRDLYKIDNHIMEPDFKKIKKIRNCISHKYLMVFYEEYLLNNEKNNRYSISDQELKEQAIKLLKLSRSALIGVSLAAHFNEIRNMVRDNKNMPITLMPLDERKPKYR